MVELREKIVSCMRHVGVGAALALGLLTTGASTAAVEKEVVKIGVPSTTNLYSLTTILTHHLGYYADEGVKVELVSVGSGGKMMQALIADGIDIGNGVLDHVVQLRAKGIPLTSFVLQANLQDYAMGIIKGKLPDYKGPEDLAGAKIGIAAPGGGLDIFLKVYLAKHGIEYKNVKVVAVGTEQRAISAVRSGELDVIANTDPAIGLLEYNGELGEMIADVRTLDGSSAVYGGEYPSSTLLAKESFIEQHPATIQALTNANVRTLKWLRQASVDDLIAALPKEFMIDNMDAYRHILRAVMNTQSPDGRFPDDAAKTVIDTLGQFNPEVAAGKFDAGKVFTNRFVDIANHR